MNKQNASFFEICKNAAKSAFDSDDQDCLLYILVRWNLFDQTVVRISHIGSTAIQGIWAKNIVDVMVEISEKADMEKMARALEQNGFIKRSGTRRLA